MSLLTKRNGSAIFADGGSLTFTFTDTGDIQIGPLEESMAPAIPIMERGVIADYVLGDEAEVSGTFSCNMRTSTFTDGTNQRTLDVVRATGAWAAMTSTLSGAVSGDPKMGAFTAKWTKGGVTASIKVDPCRLACTGVNESGEALTASFSFHGKLSTVV